MKKSLLLPVAIVALLLGLGIGTASMAQHGHGHGYEDGAGSGHHMMMHDGRGCDGLGDSWQEGLSQEQKNKILQMKVDYMKGKYPKKARIKSLKMELAVLVTEDKPDQKAIDARVDEIVTLKKALMKAKYAHKIAVRQQLKPEQQAAFDKHVLRKAKARRCAR